MKRPITDDELLGLVKREDEPPNNDDAIDALIAEEAAKMDAEGAQPSEVDPRQKLAQLIAQRKAEPTGPGDLERSYTENMHAPSKANRIASIIGTLLTGQDYIGKHNDERDNFAAGLMKAQAADAEKAKGRQFVDQSTGELLLKAGLSPEAAADTRWDSPALKLSNNLGMIDTRIRGQDLTAQQKAEHDAQLLEMLDRRLGVQKQIADDRNETSIKTAGIRAKKGGTGAPMTPEARAAHDAAEASGLAAFLSDSANVPYDIAKKYVGGETEGIDPTQAEKLQKFHAQFALLPQAEKNRVLKANMARESAAPDSLTGKLAAQAGNVEKMRAVRDELLEDKASLKEAVSSWKALTPKAQAALVQYGGIAPSQIVSALKSAGLTDKEQIAASRVQRLVNSDIKRISGSAVTANEGGRQGTAIGMAAGDFNPWQSPAVLGDYLMHARGVLEGRWNSATVAYPNLWEGVEQ